MCPDPYMGKQNGTDDFRFTQIPAGRLFYQSQNGDYYWKGLHKYSYFWSSTENTSDGTNTGAKGYENMSRDNFYKNHYFSVHCVMGDKPGIEEQLDAYDEIED